MPTNARPRRWLIATSISVLLLLAVAVGTLWLVQPTKLPGQRASARGITLAALKAANLVHLAAWVLLPALTLLFCAWTWIRRRRSRPIGRVGRLALLVSSLSCLLVGIEFTAFATLRQARRVANLPTTFPLPRDPSVVTIAVIGESSALGVPYDPWVSVPAIVAWKLEQALAPRRVEVEMLAQGGICLEQAIPSLGQLRRPPDLLIVFSGHNEFQARFGWERNVRYYVDEQPPPLRSKLERWWRNSSPIAAWIAQAIDRQMLDLAPQSEAPNPIVDHPAFRADEYDELVEDFERRLDALLSYARRIGAIPIVIAPAGNEADLPPSRSYLRADTPARERTSFERSFRAARELEATAPEKARRLLLELERAHPEFAELQSRLGELDRSAGEIEAARVRFERARDLDGMPMRCPGRFTRVMHRVTAHHNAVYVDAREVLQRENPLVPSKAAQLLDNSWFHDPQHTNLKGYTAIAHEVLRLLRSRQALGWPADAPLGPDQLDIACAEAATHFQMTPSRWAEVCDRTAILFIRLAKVRGQPLVDLAWSDRLLQAANAIRAGTAPEMCGIPGIGLANQPLRLPSTPHTSSNSAH